MPRSAASRHPTGAQRFEGAIDGDDPWLDLRRVMASMPARLQRRPPPPVVAVTVSPQAIGLLLRAPCSDPAMGFEAIDDGMTWMIERSTLAATAAPVTRRVPWPLLVPLGHVQPHGSLVLCNLEEFGAVELIGESADVGALAEYLATGVVADHFGARSLMVCVDCGWHLAGVSGVRVAGSLHEVLADVERHRAHLASGMRPRALPGACGHGSQRVPPALVVIDPHTRNQESIDRLRALAGPGLAVVTAPGGGDGAVRAQAARAAWALEVTGRDIRWHPVGVDLRFARCDRASGPEPLGGIPWRRSASGPGAAGLQGGPGGAVAGRGTTAPETPPGSSYDASGLLTDPPGAGHRVDVPGATPGPVELQVLGVVQVAGAQVPFTSQRALDLACFLAFHRDGATADRLRYWLWQRSEPLPSRKSFANVVSRARVCLGRDIDGGPYLSRVGADGVYRLSPKVTTDLERFTTWRTAAGRAPPAQALELLVAALSIVRGAPFGGGSGGTFSWADASWRSHVEYLVDSTFHWLADQALELGRMDIARWATVRGLAVTPDCEQCYQRRMAVAQRSGDRRELSEVMRHMHRLDSEPLLLLNDSDGRALGGEGSFDDLPAELSGID